LRKAAVSIGLPKFLARGVPPIWGTENALRTCKVPVLIVHGEEDQLFPVQMAEELNAFCGTRSELVIVPKLSHKEPFYHPDLSYWGLIISWMLREGGTKASTEGFPEK
jgi:pimeloyl-ACP methyl ester carboxylesterase